MFRRNATVAFIAMVLCCTAPATAQAIVYRHESVTLGFGASYVSAGGESRTHRGIDLIAAAGESVPAPSSGTVSFVGSVPGASGGTVRAVTIDGPFGKVSLMPFDQVDVKKGQSVSVGDSMGLLASSGDHSAAMPHLHLGLRAGELYLDPSVLLVLGPSVDGETVVPDVAAEGAAADTEPAGSLVVQPSGQTVVSEVLQTSPQVSGVTQVHAVPSAVEVPATGVSVSAHSIGEGVSVSPAADSMVTGLSGASSRPIQGAAPTASPLETAAGGASRALHDGVRRVAMIGSSTVCVLLALAAGTILLLRMRAFERRVTGNSPVSHRLGIVLQQLRTGATLRGFTSCPGLTAFTVPGPSSPGEVTK
jgi:murein DD-endopeptidase MepM/ murein hydrolase activator NlpD